MLAALPPPCPGPQALCEYIGVILGLYQGHFRGIIWRLYCEYIRVIY